MDAITLITILVTIAAVLAVQRFLPFAKTRNEHAQSARTNYREEAFAEIIKINDNSIRQGMLDPLTGLPGRQVYDERLRMILAHSKQYNQICSVMILNIDEFNNINRIYGGVFGNKLLAEAANRLRTVLRQIDTVSRYAGDSFFFILPELSNPEVAVLVAQRIQDSIIQPFNIGTHRIFVTASIGISLFSGNISGEQLLKNAEEALTKAKMAGRNTYRIHNQPESSDQHHDNMLDACIQDRNFISRLVMLYQPYIDIENNKTRIMQAIPNFNHPEQGLIPFTDFFQAVEKCRKMVDFGKWQLQEAIKQINHWQANGMQVENIMLSVTANQLENSNFIHKVSEILQQTSFDSGQIIFDIFESNTNINSKTFTAALDTAAIMGIQVSIGIMALGRMALHNIADFPINYLRVDEHLVKALLVDMNESSIITSLISLANLSNIEVIASGIEQENERTSIMALGCKIMQGRLFTQPLAANEIYDAEMSKEHV